jgi:acyl-CoA synthetase (NDP forming)
VVGECGHRGVRSLAVITAGLTPAQEVRLLAVTRRAGMLKADVPGLLHKTVEGAVELDLHGGDEVRAAMGRLQARFAGRMSGVLVEPMITGGIETLAGVVQEPVFGPVVVFGPGGIATGVLDGDAARHRHGRAHAGNQRAPRRPVPAPTPPVTALSTA